MGPGPRVKRSWQVDESLGHVNVLEVILGV